MHASPYKKVLLTKQAIVIKINIIATAKLPISKDYCR